MNKPSPDQGDRHQRRVEAARRQSAGTQPPDKTETGESGRAAGRGVPEAPASRTTFPKRTRKPGEAGLANEARPGLGSRADDADPGATPDPKKQAKSRSKPEATPRGYEEPRPEPREQAPDSMAHEEERSTGVSGHTGNT